MTTSSNEDASQLPMASGESSLLMMEEESPLEPPMMHPDEDEEEPVSEDVPPLQIESSSSEEEEQSLSEESSLTKENEALDPTTSEKAERLAVLSHSVPTTPAVEEEAPSSSCLGWRQTFALLRKNFITKIRTPLPTFFEIFSPVLMMLILVAAYSLSEITYKDAKMYSDIQVDIPGPWLNLLSSSADIAGSNILSNRRILEKTIQENGKLDPVRINFLNGWDFDLSFQEEDLTGRWLQELDDDLVENSTTTYRDVFGLLNDAQRQISRILKSPIGVPTFRQYVSLSLAISSLIDADDLPDILTDSSYGREWGNLLTLGTLHLSPINDMAKDFERYLKETYPQLMNDVNVRLHETEKDALDYINANLDERTWALLDFDSVVEQELRYKIRMNYTTLPNTNQITDYVSIGLNTQYQRYYLSGYLTLQRTLNAFMFSRTNVTQDDELCTAAQEDDLGVWSMPMPTAAYSQNSFFAAVGYLLGLTIAMAFLYPVSRFIKSLVEEKETRMKETLFILGVRAWAHWLSWVLTSLIVFFIISILVTVTLSNNVLKYSSGAYLFAFIGLFSSATIGFSFFIAAFFSRAKLAAIIGPVALFATLLPRFIFFGTNRYEATTGKSLASLLPCTAFAFGADIVADYEYAEQGVQSYNASEGEYSFNTTLGFLFFDTILYMFLGWYLDQVIPRQYGVARKWYFLVSPKYWCSVLSCGNFNKSKKPQHAEAGSSVDMSDWSQEGNSLDFEPVNDPTLVPRVRIRDLVKRYNKKANVAPAVDNLNLDMYEGQITCLLGHNGAGKTTAISVLTGLFPPTSGDCSIYGNSVIDDLTHARQSMGICPQHNVLFDSLTVTEHLALFERIKGIRPTKAGVRERAREIGLSEFNHTTSSALSGGNKRKLSLAIALCGSPKFLILDEPTAGIDPASRRACWELLRQKRKGRVTLLTTHFMDEAELLADRIAVMKEGKLQCCGSSLFLKNRFGLGYNLTLVLNRGSQNVSNSEGDIENGQVDPIQESTASKVVDPKDIERITNFLKSHIANTELVRKSARELTYRFPQGTEDMFPTVFDALEEVRDSLCIGAYGITNTTLEEVFLQLAEEQENKLGASEPIGLEVDAASSKHMSGTKEDLLEEKSVGDAPIAPPVETTVQVDDGTSKTILANGRPTADPSQASSTMELEHMGPMRQIRLLYNKRFVVQKRDVKGACFMIVLPIALIALVLLILTIDIQLAGPAIEMDMDLYRKSPSGSQTRTDVLMGGGGAAAAAAAARSNDSTAEMDQMYSSLSSTLGQEYEHADFLFLEEVVSSRQLSQHLLDTYNDHSHDARYGAFVFKDAIDTTISIDFDALRDDLVDLTSFSVGVEDQVDIFELLGVEKGARPVSLNVSVSDLASFIYSATTLSEESGINTTRLEAVTSSAILDILVSSADIDRATEWYGDVLNELGSTLPNLVNSTDIDATQLVEALFSFTSVTSLLDETLQSEDIFSRDAVNKAYEDIISEVLMQLAVGQDLDVSSVVDSAISLLDEAVSTYGNFSSVPNSLLATPIIVLDFILENFIESNGGAVVTLGDVFKELSKLLGGDAELLNGYVQISISSALIDLSTMLVTVTDLLIETESEVLLNINGPVSVSLSSITDILFIIPAGKVDYNFDVDTTASILHNATSPHAVASFNQAYSEYLYKKCSSSGDVRLVSVNHPLPLTTQQSVEIRTILSVLASLFILIPFCYILGAFIVFPVKERVSKSKHLQLVSGVNMSSYWVATYLWDLTLFAILTAGVMIVFLLYGNQSAEVFVGSVSSFFATLSLTFGYGMSALPFSYLLSRMFDNHSSAQIAVMGIFFITGFVAVNAYFIMSSIESTEDVADALRPLFRMWPAYNVGEGFIQLSASYFQREVLGEDSQPFDWDVAGKNIALCYLLSIPYFLLHLLLEYSADGGSGGFLGRMLRSLRASYEGLILRWNGVRKTEDGSLLLDDGLDDESPHNESEDEDVAEERSYVLQNKEDLVTSASVLMVNLWKVYPPSVGILGSCIASLRRLLSFICCCRCFRCRRPEPEDNDDNSNLPKRAVRGLSTAIHEGETFGLLGQNGGGKTTTLNVLTGDITPTGGEAYVAGHDVTGSVPGAVSEARKHIGFCPQVDPLLDLMTGRETLTMFARLRGIPQDHLDSAVTELLERLTLTPHADKTAESYSGGNKRKLSLGVALIGDPKVLFIDESSSGMDPAARRHMWSLIEEVSQRRSVILTTHSMEEAEALCTRVGIMVHGQLLCLGSVQHLKSTYLDGYTIDVHCARGTPDHVVDAVEQEILNNALPGSRLSERHAVMLRFDVPSLSSLGLGTTFRRLQSLKQNPDLCVENYSISQCSLEQVFMSLVRSGAEPEAEQTLEASA